MSNKKTSRFYEVCIHFIPTLDESAVSKEFKVAQETASSLGKVVSVEEPQLMELAYTIRHKIRNEEGSYERFVEAYFCSIKCEIESGAVNQIKENLQANESVLRFLIVETVEGDTRTAPLKEDEEESEDEETTTDAGSADAKSESKKEDAPVENKEEEK